MQILTTNKNDEKIRVLFEFVDMLDRPNELVPSPEPPEQFYIGMPIIVVRGKHEGRTGKVAVRERKIVRIIEDETAIEVRSITYSRQNLICLFL